MYIINPTSGKEIPNSYPTSTSTGSNSSNSSSNSIINNASSHQQEIISKILTKCATMTDEVAASGTPAATTVNGTATILLSPSHHHSHHHQSHPVGVSPQSSPASTSSSASSPTADAPQQLHPSFGKTGHEKTPAPGKSGESGATGGQNGTTTANSIGLSFGGDGTGSKHAQGTGSGGKVNGNNTATVSATNASGGRLQFFKDGKFILELARAREGEKTSWISVPRKTFWPPTVSSTSANFHKHESSTSLSFSDDNSSIQSSPWQRDHCWKQPNPRSNISKEMALYYHRPNCVRFKLARDVLKRLRLKRRRPYEQQSSSEGGTGGIALNYEIIRDRQLSPPDNTEDDAMDLKVNGKVAENATNDEDQKDDRSEISNGLGAANGTRNTSVRRFRGMLKRRKELDSIVQQLKVRVATSMGNMTPRVPTAAGLRSVFNSSHQQHVSPRKRILRELEKVSLEDSSTTKRSRPKPGSNSTVITATTATPLAPVTSNGTSSSSSNNSNNNSGNNSNSNGKLTNGLSPMPEPRHTATIPTTPVSRPISSYSITSLLGHNSSNESSNRPKQMETNPTTSHHPYQHPHSSHYQYLGKDVIAAPKSPSDTHLSQRYYGKKKSPSYGTQSAASPSSATEFGVGYGIRSPDLSPSPEHQTHSSFTRYRQHPYSMHPTVSSPSSSYSTVSRCSPSPSTNDSTSSPYSGNAKYRPAYLASSGSPPSSTATASGSANSPQHYSRQSPLNFARSPPPTHQSSYLSNSNNRTTGAKDSPSSPRASPSVESVRGGTTTSTSSSSTTPSIRTVPKKTAALRQQFGSPSSSPSTSDQTKRERSNSNASSTCSEVSRNAHYKKELDYAERSASSSDVVDGHPVAASTVIRPSTVIASPTPHHAGIANPFYMYPPQIAASLIAAQQSSAVPFLPASPLTSYYQHMYNQAAVAAAYRNPLWMHYQGLSPHAAAAAAAAAAVSPPSSAPPPLVPSSTATGQPSSNRDAQQRDSSRTHSANVQSNANNNHSSSSSPSPTISAMNYSASVLASSPHHVYSHQQQFHHGQHPRHSSPWRVPASSSSSSALIHDPIAVTALSSPTVVSSSAASSGAMVVEMKEDSGADVPLNLSKH
ncbi:protein hairless [Wyeomyia smithii]|uniref:protein hairless n=1 Tax=Wyeomyia smithii TaxID=174621 RepID=UPI0024681FEA|nr:protein hairless [Wyeomyia smithii]XP_055524664.1 protein hairless [Wyeomyia smithii]